jgi:hypothetical protein
MTSVLLINDQLDKRDGDASGSDEEDVWKQMEVEVGFAKSKQR